MASFEDIKDFIDKYPQFRQLQTNACKHMAVAVELNRKIDARRLLEVTEMEQELACVEAHQVACEKLIPFLEDPRFTATDKLKVAMIYALRYEARPKHESQVYRFVVYLFIIFFSS
jgi:vacuolar protein sorting-associated protein 45